MKLSDINALPLAEFLAQFGDVAEHSPWVAREAASYRPFVSRDAMVNAFERAVKSANHDARLMLVCAHPDLATKACLTDDSMKEQADAGLGALTPDEFAQFTNLNTRYKECFGFPFIFAVKGATKHMIIEAFEQRVGSGKEVEFATAIAQVCRIFRFRIEDRVQP